MRVAWDMTHAGRIKTGTGAYARNLVPALEKHCGLRIMALTQPRILDGRAAPVAKLLRGAHQVFWTQASMGRELRKRRVDLLHSPAYVSTLLSPCPSVVTIHDLAYLRYPAHYSRMWLLYLKVLVPLVVGRAQAVIADSQHAKADTVRYLGQAPEKVHVVHLGVDHGRFNKVTDSRRLSTIAAKYSLDAPFLLHVGALASRKNIPLLLTALSLLKGAGDWRRHRVVLVGEAAPDMPGLGEIHMTIERLGLERDVRFLGHVPDDDLPAIYTLAELLVMPTLLEGFGLPLLEAMACGLPVVASEAGSVPEVTGDAAMLVPPSDERALADAIALVLRDREVREELVGRGLRRAQEFTWERAAEETVSVYRQVLAASRNRGPEPRQP